MKRLYATVALVILLSVFSLTASAAIDGPYSTQSVSEDEWPNFAYTLNLQQYSEEYTGNGTVESFDVNQKGEILISINNHNQYHINFYQTDGTFAYGFYLQPRSGSIIVFFDRTDGGLVLYDIRSAYFTKINSEGQCLEVEKLKDGVSPAAGIEEIRSKKEFRVNNIIYRVTSNDSVQNMPTLTMYTPDGKSKVIFQQTERSFFDRYGVPPLLIVVMIGGVLVFCVYLIRLILKKHHEKALKRKSESY